MSKIVRKKKRNSVSICLYDFESSLKNFRDKVLALIDDYGEDASVSVETEYEYGGYERQYFLLTYFVLETEKEAEKRVKAAKKRLESRKKTLAKKAVLKEEKERKELERLLRKYGES